MAVQNEDKLTKDMFTPEDKNTIIAALSDLKEKIIRQIAKETSMQIRTIRRNQIEDITKIIQQING